VESPVENPLDRYTEHSPEWWGAVYEMHSEAAYRGALAVYRTNRVSFDAAELEDVVQEVFTILQETGAITNKTGNMGGYIRRCARNNAIDRARRQQKIADPTTEGPDGVDRFDVGLHDEGLDRVEELDEFRHQAATVRTNIDQLTKQEWRVARMMRQGLTREQIAFNEGVSKARITHIKTSIRRKLQVGYGLRTDGTRMTDDE
jgi:RNA polymerase sigma factor (sigma-70 family)